MATRLKNMKIRRVDLVDAGANPEAHIVIAKADDRYPRAQAAQQTPPAQPRPGAAPAQRPGAAPAQPRPNPGQRPAPSQRSTPSPSPLPSGGQNPMAARRSGLADRISTMLGERGQDDAGAQRNPLTRAPGNRIAHIRPADFEVISQDGNMMEWAIPKDKLPEGVEAAELAMARQGDAMVFQWMIDPIMGPPVEGTAKTAPEAFMAMRSALTQTGAMGGPEGMLGGLPMGGTKPGAKPGAGAIPGANPGANPGMGQQQSQQKKPLPGLGSAIRKARVEKSLTETLDLIVKGLIEVDVFAESATGRDLADILPEDLLAEIRNKLSA